MKAEEDNQLKLQYEKKGAPRNFMKVPTNLAEQV